MRRVVLMLAALCMVLMGWCKSDDQVVVAYVTSWTRVMPDPTVMTHINYAFGHVRDSFDGVRIDNEARLRSITALKSVNPQLHIMLSVGGWGSGRFSEMAASETNRKAFAADCRRVCDEYGLDGIDIDWEYPTQSSAGISCSPEDTQNFTLLMRDIRAELGKKRLLTMASVGDAKFVDFKACIQYLDFVNMMAYDMANAPKHHAALYPSEISGWNTSSGCVEAHRKAGVPDRKMVLGIPFYGRGEKGKYLKYADRGSVDLIERWDEQAQAPYLADESGTMIYGIETPRSVAVKCRYVKQQGLRGAMYWEYCDDNHQGDLQRSVWQGIMGGESPASRLVTLLREGRAREDISPDSFFYDVRELRLAIQQQSDPASRAIYQATLAHLLRLNDWRAQAYHRDTKSHPDSIREWSGEEYLQHSAALYRQAFTASASLIDTPTRKWMPLVLQGKDEQTFGSTMLHVVWQACNADFWGDMKQSYGLPGYAFVIEQYRHRGLREATLRLMLDSLQTAPNSAALNQLRQEYASEPSCALVYMRLAENDSLTDEQKYQLLDEALKRYPKCQQRSEILNRQLMLQHPQLELTAGSVYYPGADMKLPLKLRNMKSARITLYRLPIDFESQKEIDLLTQVRQQGVRMDDITLNFPSHPAMELWNDTLHYDAPPCGVYALVLEGATTARLTRNPAPQVKVFRTSQLAFFYYSFGSTCRVAVVDGMTGQPQEGVDIELYEDESHGKDFSDELRLILRTRSDARGLFEFPSSKSAGGRYRIRLSRPGDEALSHTYFFAFSKSDTSEQSIRQLRVFTDRSIYRPGQTVYVSGVQYDQKGLDAIVREDTEQQLQCLDANRQKVCNHKLKSDDFGVFQDSIVLPQHGLPGTYTIRLGNAYASIQVEEYRRPTFQIEMLGTTDDGQQVDEGKVVLRGRATTYSGVPLSHARVTAEGRWKTVSRYGPSVHYYAQAAPIDTAWTDDSGLFQLEVTVPNHADALRVGLQLSGSVDVLSDQGETQQVDYRLQICSTPLRMKGDVETCYDRAHLKPVKIDLVSPTGNPIETTLTCRLLQEGVVKHSFTLPANTSVVPADFASLPSGCYLLRAEAEVKGDTTSWSREIILYSMQDSRMAVKQDLWLQVSDSCSVDRPAQIQVGSSLKDAWVYLTVQSEVELPIDTILHLSDTLVTMTLPFHQDSAGGMTVLAGVYHDGNMQERKRRIDFAKPDYTLRPHWDTFRDHLRPGDHEEWRLTLCHPDGTPARANVMLSLYDASLDALYRHSVRMTINRNRRYSGWNLEYPMMWNRYSTLMYDMNIRLQKSRDCEFSRFDEQYFLGVPALETMSFGKNGGVRRRSLADPMVYYSMESSSAPVMKSRAVVEMNALNGQIAGLPDSAGNDEAAQEDNVSTADVPLRSNLQELAFFNPCLRTDEQGKVSISFTLPESMTSWHLQGFAHTRNLMTVQFDETIVAQKELMAELALPRFLRDGDEVMLTASIRNVSDRRQSGKATWIVSNAENDRELKRLTVRFDLPAHADSTYYLPLQASIEQPLLAVQWSAVSEDCSDGERRCLPVLTQLQPITETRSYMLQGDSILRMDLTDLFAHDNPKAVNRTLTIEHVAHPLLLAIQSLPSMMAPVRDDALSLATRYYAGRVACQIARKYPEVHEAIGQWAQREGTLQSPLVSNQELSSTILQETPWVVDAKRQEAAYSQLYSLLDEMKQDQRRQDLLNALGHLQQPDGSFAWFPGMRGSSWVTTEVAELLTRLQQIAGRTPTLEREMLTRAVKYLQSSLKEHIAQLQKQQDANISLSDLRYLYVVLFSDNMKNVSQQDVDFLLDRLRHQASSLDREERALAAIVLQKGGEEKIARTLMPRLHELLEHQDGLHLDYPGGSFTSIDRKVQTHVRLMETIRQVEPEDTLSIARMSQWLLQQKRSTAWEQPVQSADAIYALLQSGMNQHPGDWRSKVLYDRQEHIIRSPQPFYSYVRERLTDVKHPKHLYVEQKNTQGGMAWGAVYAQFQLPATEVEAQREGMNIRRDVENADGLRVGDRVHVRYTITVDRDYEYVVFRAPRPAVAEPASVLSGYRWQGGAGYYCALHDASSEYFFDALLRGTYVIEEDWLIARSGTFVLPAATMQCVYAPAFQSHTDGGNVSAVR